MWNPLRINENEGLYRPEASTCNDCEHEATVTRIYLDHAATTPVIAAARGAMAEALGNWANPSSVHAEGRAARAALEEARRCMLKRLGARPGARLVFTSGATEALALALGRTRADHVLVGATEHDAVLRAVPDTPRVAVDHCGRIDIEVLRRQLGGSGPALVAVQHVNNETGVVQNIPAIADAVREAGGVLLADAAQSAGKLPLPDADMVAVSAHKLGGPPGIGALILREERLIAATGGQERGLRGGTENLPAIMGFAAAVEAVAGWADATLPLQKRLETGVREAGGAIIAADADRAGWISAVQMPGVAAATQLMHFDLAGVAVSAGAACSSGSMKQSHVLQAMGVAADAANEVIRVSLAPSTTAAEIDAFLAAWRTLRDRAGTKAA